MVDDAIVARHCAANLDCDVGDWCNPGPETCASRNTQVSFDRDIYPKIDTVCVGCHLPNGLGAKDATRAGVLALFDGGADATWQVLVAGGTSCTTEPHRLCVDDPRSSLMVQRLLPPNAVAVELPLGYKDDWIQMVMAWVASGAPRPDSHAVVDAGVDAPADAMPAAPDAMPICPADATPSTDACAISEQYGVFVSPDGNDGNAGSRRAPFATFMRAITEAHATHKRVYACGGGYRGNIVIDSSLDGTSIFGSLDCNTWAYVPTAKPEIRAANIPIIIDGCSTGAHLEDVKVIADNAVAHGESSIAMLVYFSNAVTMVRSELVAGTGASGGDGPQNASFLSGTDGSDGERACPCVDPAACSFCDPLVDPTCWATGINSCGGIEVSGGIAGPSTWPTAGLPLEMSGGAPGVSAGMSCYLGQSYCSEGQAGEDGIDYPPVRSDGEPELLRTGWHGVRGQDGFQGGPGQGAGAGGNGTNETYQSRCYPRDPERCEDASYAGRSSGGGGGSGGCGGPGGSGGEPGGASVALISISSHVSIRASKLDAVTAGDAGRGGAGAPGEPGGHGGLGGAGVPSYPFETRGCRGGTGGHGGKGGAGAGGAGGPSAAIAYLGTIPTLDPSSQLGRGAAGRGALDGDGGTIGKGRDGQSIDVLYAPGIDTIAPAGGGASLTMLTPCAALTVQLLPATDDRTPPNEIRQEICWSDVAGHCLAAFENKAIATDVAILDLHLLQGQTAYLATRPVDASGNHGAISAELAIAIPSLAVWPAGAVTITPAASFGQYDIHWSAIAPSCPSQVVSVALCDASDDCIPVSATATSATRTGDCSSATYTVKVTNNLSPPEQRSATSSWPVTGPAISAAYGRANCRSCHPAGTGPPPIGSPQLTSGAVDKVLGHRACVSNAMLISSDASTSDIFRVASAHSHICDGAGHSGGSMSDNDLALLRCWIGQGAP
jgi:hypothetical protein